MHVPMEVDSVSGSESEEEDGEDVDEAYSCGVMGHCARDCRRKGKGEGTGGDGSE